MMQTSRDWDGVSKKTWLSIVLVVLAAMDPNPLKAAMRVTVTNGALPLVQVPVTASLAAAWQGKNLVLVAKNGQQLPTQLETVPPAENAKESPVITWIIPQLAANETVTYTLAEAPPAKKNAKTGVFVKPIAAGLDISVDDKPFTTYYTHDGPKPFYWPILTDHGKPVTRAYPMREDVPPKQRHNYHHRSMWFTLDHVNGLDFWSETEKSHLTVHQSFDRLVSGPVFGEFVSRVAWLKRDGQPVTDDVRRLRVYRTEEGRLMDFDLTWKATHGPLQLGDTKEGLFAFRVASSITVDQPDKKPGGTIINANGQKNAAAWGKPAVWCDYYGPVDGETLGLAIFDNQQNLRHPTTWHVRTYGLFTANPFGLSHFTGDSKQDGSYQIDAGKDLRFQYRVYVHRGDVEQAKVKNWYAAYASPPRVKVTADAD